MAARKSAYKIEVESSLKKEVDEVLKALNYPGAATAIYSLLLFIRDHKDLPVELKYNKDTLETFEKTDRGEELHPYKSVDEMFDDIENW